METVARWSLGARVAVVAVLVLAAHGLALIVPFQFDDLHQIALNPAMRDPKSLLGFFTDPYIGSSLGHLWFYRPILFVTFLVDGVIGGGSAVPYRVTSLVLLGIFAVLAGHFARVLVLRVVPGVTAERAATVGMLTAAVLAVHPVLDESILLASGRSSLLMAIFGLAALTVLVTGFRGVRGTGWILGLTALALLTKETAVVLGPLALLLVAVVRRGEPFPRRLLAAWPVIALVAAYVVFYYVSRRVGPLAGPPDVSVPTSLARNASMSTRVAEGWLAMVGLGRLYVWPVGLSLTHAFSSIPPTVRSAAPFLWAATLLAGVGLLTRRGAWHLAGIALLWFVLALAPIVTAGLNTPMAEHRIVLATVVPTVLIAFVLATYVGPRWSAGLQGTLLAVLAAMAVMHARPWRTPIDLWRHEVTVQPTSSRAWGFLTSSYIDIGDLDGARETSVRARSLTPQSVLLLGQAADIEMRSGDLVLAGRYTTPGLLIDPNHLDLLLTEAERLARLDNLAGALAMAERATRVAPQSSPAWNALGNVQLMQGSPASVASYRRAVALDAENQEARVNLQTATQRWPG